MSFNKWFPNRVDPQPRNLSPVARAVAMRVAWYVSSAMLMTGYVLVAFFWEF